MAEVKQETGWRTRLEVTNCVLFLPAVPKWEAEVELRSTGQPRATVPTFKSYGKRPCGSAGVSMECAIAVELVQE